MIKCALQYILEIKSTQIKSNVGFRGEEKTGVPGEKPLGAARVENQQTQLTYDAVSGNRTRATLMGGECSTTAPTLLPSFNTLLNQMSGRLKGQYHTIFGNTMEIEKTLFG